MKIRVIGGYMRSCETAVYIGRDDVELELTGVDISDVRGKVIEIAPEVRRGSAAETLATGVGGSLIAAAIAKATGLA